MVEEHREQLERLTQALLAAGDIDHLEIAAAMEGSTVVARRPNLQPLPDRRPSPSRSKRSPPASAPAPLGARPAGAGAAIAAFRAERDVARP